MILRAMILVVLAALGVSCREAPTSIEITETRSLTIWDQGYDPLIAPMPLEWRQVPSTQHRVFNYRFGEGKGEVYISRARGGILPNANRWLKQFGKPDVQSLDEFQKVSILGSEGVLVSASGFFSGGMGKPAQDDMGVLGVIAGGEDSLLTVKMIGPADLVEAERERLIKFCESLRVRGSEKEENVTTDSGQ